MMQVLAHDPEVTELNMSIFTGPAQSGTLSGSAAEVKQFLCVSLWAKVRMIFRLLMWKDVCFE
jgi:hypothetical protein